MILNSFNSEANSKSKTLHPSLPLNHTIITTTLTQTPAPSIITTKICNILKNTPIYLTLFLNYHLSSIGSKVFRGCRALLGPAATKAKTVTVSKPTTSTPRTTGIMKPIPVSSALGDFLGSFKASRAEAVKKIWA
ncbi:hypothetical protein ACFE04_029177 [Oxalis oulophora]